MIFFQIIAHGIDRHLCPHIVITDQNDLPQSGIYQVNINHGSVIVVMSALNVHTKGILHMSETDKIIIIKL